MIQTSPPRARRRRLSSLRLVVLLLPVVMGLGCAGSDDKEDAVATPTVPVVSTATATLRPNTATPTGPVANTATATVPPSPATPTPTAPTPDIALAACQKLSACNQCFSTERGTCLDPAQCAARLSEDEARCINTLAGCNATGLGDCLTVGCGGDGTVECD